MKTKMAWIFGGGVSIAAAALAASLGGCSGGDNNFTDGGKDGTTTDTGNNKDTGNNDTGNNNDTGPIQDAGPDCKTPSGPFTTDAGPFCPFQAGDGGNNLFSDCANGQHCCVYKGSSTPSTCNAANVACNPIGPEAGTTDFQCEESNDCTSGICCLNTPAYLSQDVGCTSYYFVSKQAGTTCQQSCSGQAQICGSNADCTGGKTCQPVNTKGIWLGACVGADGGV